MSNSELIDCTRESEKWRMRESVKKGAIWGGQIKRNIDCKRGDGIGSEGKKMED